MTCHDTVENLFPNLACRLEQVLAELGTGSRTGLFTLSLAAVKGGTLVVRKIPDHGVYLYTACPEQQRMRLGLGCAWRHETGGSARFDDLQNAFRKLQSARILRQLDPELPQPAAFLGFAFDAVPMTGGLWRHWPNALLHVPELLLQQDGETICLHLSAGTADLKTARQRIRQIERWRELCAQGLALLSEPETKAALPADLQRRGSQPDETGWLSQVERARQAIHAGSFSKLVPARQVSLAAALPISPVPLMRDLERRFPSCTQLGIRVGETNASGLLLAATPETLVRLRQGRLHCDALGGTRACGDGGMARMQSHEALMRNPRIRREHALVVDHIRRSLTPLCRSLRVPGTPSVMELRRLQHLWTPVEGEVNGDVNLLAIAARLHPTPAVAGTPAVAAQAWLRRHEGFERGWYTGAAGWLDADGGGELSVVLRCALLDGKAMHLYAGAGVVADSDPLTELAETELKLSALLDDTAESGSGMLPPRIAG